MSWLDGVRTKRQRDREHDQMERVKPEAAAALRLRSPLYVKGREVDSMVRRLLHDVGDLQWGRRGVFGAPYRIETGHTLDYPRMEQITAVRWTLFSRWSRILGEHREGWVVELIEEHEKYLGVRTVGEPGDSASISQSRFCFSVVGVGLTKDTSSEELQRLLRGAIEKGPDDLDYEAPEEKY